MTKLADLQKDWEIDCEIHAANIEVETLRVPKLHSKYLNHLTNEKLLLHQYQQQLDSVEDKLTQYFLGITDGKDIGRPPCQLKLTNARAEKMVKADQEYMQAALKVSGQEEKILFLKDVVSQINMRSYHIKNYIEWKKWTAGSG